MSDTVYEIRSLMINGELWYYLYDHVEKRSYDPESLQQTKDRMRDLVKFRNAEIYRYNKKGLFIGC